MMTSHGSIEVVTQSSAKSQPKMASGRLPKPLLRLHIFAKTYNIPRLHQDAMDHLVWCNNTAYGFDHAGTFVSASSIRRAYEHTEPGSPLRKLLISGFSDFFSFYGEHMVDLPHRYLIDVAENFKLAELSSGAREPVKDGFVRTGCFHHEHETEGGKRECKIRVIMNRGLEILCSAE